MLGLAGGRIRSAAAVIGAPRLSPFAPHAGRRCPLAAPPLLGPAALDGLLARLAPRAPPGPLPHRRAPEPDARSLKKIPPFPTGGAARSNVDKVGGANGVPGRRDDGAGVDKRKVNENAGKGVGAAGHTKEDPSGGDTARITDGKGVDEGGRTKEAGGDTAKTTDGKDGVDASGRTKHAGGSTQAKGAAFPAKDPDAVADNTTKIPPFSAGGAARPGGGKVGGANGVPGKGSGVDSKAEEHGGGKDLDAGGRRTKEPGGGGGDTAKVTDGKDIVDAGGSTKEAGAAVHAKDADAGGNISKGSNGGEEELNPAVSKNLIVSFAKVVETVLKKSLKAEWKIVNEDLHDHSRRIVYMVLAGVLLEMVIVVAAAMVGGTWLGILKAKQLIKHLTTSQESMEMYQKAADAALDLLYNALMGKGRKMIDSLLGKAKEEDKVVEQLKPAGENEASAGAGENEASAGGEGERTGEGALLMLMMFVIFLF
ncbi:unnamed protein product [Urochloa humidicola]